MSGRVCVDYAGPKHDRFFRDALERVQSLRPLAVAAKCGERTQQRKFWNDKIDNLRRLHTESAFAKEIRQRIRRLVISDLQNSLIDCEDDDLARTIGFVADMQRFARLCFCRGL